MLLEEFKDNLIEDGKSANTVQSYVGYILGFIKYLRKMGVEFDGILKMFYITSYKNYLIENNYEPADTTSEYQESIDFAMPTVELKEAV